MIGPTLDPPHWLQSHRPERQRVNQATQFAQFTLLDEVPGLIFGLMTVVYIVSSLWLLA